MVCWSSLVAQMMKNPPIVWKTWVWSLGWEDLLEEGMETHSSILARRIPVNRGALPAAVSGVAKNWTLLSDKAQMVCYILFLFLISIMFLIPSYEARVNLIPKPNKHNRRKEKLVSFFHINVSAKFLNKILANWF